MESTFGDEANHHYVLGYSYPNLDIVYRKSKKLVEAKQCCETALKIYNQAKDWADDKQKNEHILSTKSKLYCYYYGKLVNFRTRILVFLITV